MTDVEQLSVEGGQTISPLTKFSSYPFDVNAAFPFDVNEMSYIELKDGSRIYELII